MVWCPIHNCYARGKRDKAFHIEKYKCDYVENYKSSPAFAFRKPRSNVKTDMMTLYISRRNRSHRSVWRTEQKRKK